MDNVKCLSSCQSLSIVLLYQLTNQQSGLSHPHNTITMGGDHVIYLSMGGGGSCDIPLYGGGSCDIPLYGGGIM